MSSRHESNDWYYEEERPALFEDFKRLYEDFKRTYNRLESFQEFLYDNYMRAGFGGDNSNYQNFRRILYENLKQVQEGFERYLDFERHYGVDEEHLYEIFIPLYEIYDQGYGYNDVEQPLDPNTNNDLVLLDAVENGSIDSVKLLLEQGADPNVTDQHDNPILNGASYNGFADIVEILLAYGADPNITDSAGVTPLYRAVEQGNLKSAEVLLNHPMIQIDKSGAFETFLTRAIRNKDHELAKLLLEKGVDPNSVNLFGNSPLHIVAEDGQLDLVTLLLSYDADRLLLNGRGQTVAQVARTSGHHDIADYIDHYQKVTYTKRAKP